MAKSAKLPACLPPSFYKFFWDVDAQKVNPGKNPYYVINRLLDKGDLEAARWVVRSFPKEIIIETLKTMRDFSPWNGTFWARMYDLRREEVKCLQEPYLTMRKQLWPY